MSVRPITGPRSRMHAPLPVPAETAELVVRVASASASRDVVVVGSLPPAELRSVQQAWPTVVTLGTGRHDVHPGGGPEALRDLLGRFASDTLYLIAGNGLDPRHVDKCLYALPRGAGTLLLPLGHARGPRCKADVDDQLRLWDPAHRASVTSANGRQWLVVRPRRRVHVTFVMERFASTWGTSGPSINWDNLVGSLQQTEAATWSVVLHDERLHLGEPITAADLAAPPGADAHVLVCTYDFTRGGNPAPAVLQAAKAAGSKLVYVWLDSRILKHDPLYPELADLNVVLDASEFDLPRAWPSFTPKNPAWFHDPREPRPIDVSLLGEMRFLQQRKDLLPRLQGERRIDVYAPGSSATDPQRRLSNAEYARAYQQSKMSIVLTKDRVRQLKGRIFEVPLCGAMLLCDVNPYVDRFFTPHREYVPFVDYEDLIAKVRHYLEHDDERRAIAEAGSRKANRCYTARVFWDALFARLFAGADPTCIDDLAVSLQQSARG